jgi:phytoene dehydrogenase-like protein
MPWDVVIVGAGVAGLGCGALLSHKGLRVLVLEASSRLGGRANSISYEGGYTVDWGIHTLRGGDAGAGARLFQQLHLPLEVLPLGEGRLYQESAWYPLPTSVSALMSTPLLSDADRMKVGTLFGDIMSATPETLFSTSVSAWLDAHEASPAIRRIFELYAGLILIVPDVAVASMGEMLDIMHTILRSGKAAGYPKGGWKALLDALRVGIEGQGEVRFDSRVTTIRVRDGAVQGIQIGTKTIGCDTVVAAVPPSALPTRLSPTDPACKVLVEQAQRLTPTAGVSIDLGFSKPVTDAPGLIVSADPFVMGQATSNVDPTVAPPGKQLLTFYYPRPYAEIQNAQAARSALSQLETVITTLFPKLPKPEWTRRLALPVVDGAAPTVSQYRDKRLPIQTAVKGLFLVGDAHQSPGAGGDIAFNAAMTCAAKILGEA